MIGESDRDNVRDRFAEFIENFKNEQGEAIYLAEVRKMSSGQTSLVVDFKDLYSFDPFMATNASENPQEFLAALDEALADILYTIHPTYVEPSAEQEQEDKQIVKEEGLTWKRVKRSNLKVRLINYSDHVLLRAIRSIHIGKLIHISGILMRASEVKPLLKTGTFECRTPTGGKNCGEKLYVEQEEDSFSQPSFCTRCQTSKPPVKLLPEESAFTDWQRVRIQESPEELPPGKMPRSVDVTLKGDIVDVSRPGDLVKITGILRTTPDFSRRGGRLATFNVFIEANSIEVSEKEYEQLAITEEDKKQIEALADDDEFYIHDRIRESIAPSIQGHEIIKESIALLLFGGVEKTMPDGTHLRGRSNILMIGDPGTGKSQILKFVAGIASRGLYTSGKGTTAAGLTAAVVHDTDTGAMTLEAGALVLADQGIACIDEFDKMDPNDRTAIHEAMEQHSFHPSTEILFSNGVREKIGPFVDRLFEDHPEKTVLGVNCEILDTAAMNLGIYTTDNNEVRETFLDRVSRHPAPDHFIRITYDNGRDMMVTPDHPVFVFKDGKIDTVPAENLETGQFVPAPRKIPCGHNPGAELILVPATHHLAKQINMPTRLTNEMTRLLGYFVTEGCSYQESSAEIGFSTTSKLIRDDIMSLMRNLFGLEGIDYTDKNRTIRFISISLMEYLQENFPEIMTHARSKRVPPQVFVSGEKAAKSFLKSAFLGEGSTEPEGLCYRTASRNLAHDYQDLLLCIGVQSCIIQDSYNDSFKVYIRGSSHPLFKELVIEKWDSRMTKIDRIVNRLKNSNYSHDSFLSDIGQEMRKLYKRVGLPYGGTFHRAIHEGYGITRTILTRHLETIKSAHSEAKRRILEPMHSIRELRSILGWSQANAAEKINGQRSFIDYLERGGYTPDTTSRTIEELRAAIQKEIEDISVEIIKLDTLLDSDFRYLRIRSVERIKNQGVYATKYAYDVTVEPEHNFISQGVTLHNTISIAKAGIVATLNARTSILAAANPTLGRYEPSLSVQDNIKLPFTILSRFDLIWILVDTPEATKDRELAKFILGMHRTKKVVKKDTPPPISKELLKKYIAYANNRKPELTSEAAEVIENFYVELRKSAEGGAAPVPITARQLESLVRLAEARAKIALTDKVTKEDAQAAVRLMEESLRMVALDRVTGKIDIDRLVSTMSAAQRGSSDVILKAIRDLEAEGTSTISQESLIQRVVTMGLSPEKAEETIRKLVAEGILFYPREGKIKRIQT